MKILFISDIHGSTKNLDKIENIIEKENFDKIVVLGDLYYQGPTNKDYTFINSIMVKDFLTKHKNKLIALKGNCDSDVDVKSSDFPICHDLALINTDNIDLYLTHGNKYNINKNKKFIDKKGVLIYGHEHIPYIKKEKEMLYICVGSVSFPKQNNKATYTIYENKEITIFSIDGKIIEKVKI